MSNGRYLGYGGAFIPEVLKGALDELSELWNAVKGEIDFSHELQTFAGRPTPLTEVPRFAEACEAPRTFLKREDLLHTGAHKLNNALGQCFLAKKLGKNRVIAETGAGQHGVATATACARLGLKCVVYMGAVDIARQMPNVKRMQLLGATVVSVEQGSQTLKDAVNEALRDWSLSFESTHYCLGSALGPHPFPEIVREFQKVIGLETKAQIPSPDIIIACVGGGSNAIGMFAPFIEDETVQLIGVEAGGTSFDEGKHAARFATGKPGVLHGTYTYVLQDEKGQVLPTHSISAGLDYPAVGPEHAALHDSVRASYTSVSDDEAIEAMLLLSKTEGIIPALESSHALAYLKKVGSALPREYTVVINLSGRGDKDLPQLFEVIDV